MTARILVSAELEPFLAETEVPADVTVELLPRDADIPAGDFAGLIPLLTRRIGPEELDRLEGLRVVANFAVGYDNVDLAAARERGVAVTNTPDVLTEATAELTWALILAVARRVGEGERLLRSGGWTGWEPTQLLGTALGGRTLGIVGAGRIGREVGRRAGAFGMRVAYWGRTRREAWERGLDARWVPDLGDLAAASDVLTLHIASTAETRRLIDGRVLDRMPDGAILINTARGDVVDETALVERLAGGRIRAGLDVYAGEPAVPDALRDLDNVVALPHLGSATWHARRGMWRRAWENCLCGARGQEPPNRVA